MEEYIIEYDQDGMVFQRSVMANSMEDAMRQMKPGERYHGKFVEEIDFNMNDWNVQN